MPIQETPNTITVGTICYSCGLFRQCPYGNNLKSSVLYFTGDIRQKCTYFQEVEDETSQFANKSNWYKISKQESIKKISSIPEQECDEDETELNIKLYKKIAKMNEGLLKSTYNYWKYMFPPDYAEQMVTDKVETKQKNKKSYK